MRTSDLNIARTLHDRALSLLDYEEERTTCLKVRPEQFADGGEIETAHCLYAIRNIIIIIGNRPGTVTRVIDGFNDGPTYEEIQRTEYDEDIGSGIYDGEVV